MKKIERIIKEEISGFMAESNLTPQDQSAFNDILRESLNEGVDFNKAFSKIQQYGKRGLLTVALLTALLTSNVFSQEQKQQIQNLAQTEMSPPDYAKLNQQLRADIAQMDKEKEAYQYKDHNDNAIFIDAQQFMKHPQFKKGVEKYFERMGRSIDTEKQGGQIMSTSPDYTMVNALWQNGDHGRKYLMNQLNKYKKNYKAQYNPQAYN